jgi:hypothetical protein
LPGISPPLPLDPMEELLQREGVAIQPEDLKSSR